MCEYCVMEMMVDRLCYIISSTFFIICYTYKCTLSQYKKVRKCSLELSVHEIKRHWLGCKQENSQTTCKAKETRRLTYLLTQKKL